MATRINHPYSRRQPLLLSDPDIEVIPAGTACGCSEESPILEETEQRELPPDPPCSCRRCVEFCESLSIPSAFDGSELCENSVSLAYDSSFLDLRLEPVSMELALPCGGSCPVELYRISLCGVIPYMLSVGPIKGRCGDAVCLSTSGLVTVDLDLGYLCEAPGAQWKEIGCENITACTELILPESGCKTGRNLLVKGSFCFSGLSMGEAAAK